MIDLVERMEVRPYVLNEQTPPAIIVDIDGTLAHRRGRSPYDYTHVSEDEIDPVIREIVNSWRFGGPDRHVFVITGRPSSVHNETLTWLRHKKVSFDRLLMRREELDPKGHKRADYIVKYELFNEFVRDCYNVLMVLDDRQQVVDMWRKLGLRCLQVAEGDF